MNLDERLRILQACFTTLDSAGGLKTLNGFPSEQLKSRADFGTLRVTADEGASAAADALSVLRQHMRSGKTIHNVASPDLVDVALRAWKDHHLLRRLKDLCSDISLAEFLGPPERWKDLERISGHSIRRTICAALDFWDGTLEDDDPRREEVFDLSGAFEAIGAPWFTPDSWLDNERRLRPILVDSPVDMPKGLRHRLTQAYQSCLLGQWLASIALVRATLEYVLAANADRWSIEISPANGPRTRTRTLKELIAVYAECLPDIEEPMRYIQRTGNEVLHERYNSVVLDFPKGREMALSCLQHLAHVVRLVVRGPPTAAR